MLVNYFSNRRIGLFVGSRMGRKTTTMGCPQRLILEPTLWNLLLDDMFRLVNFERKESELLAAVSAWGNRNRLAFSPQKLTIITVKGRLQRAPILRLESVSIVSVAYVKIKHSKHALPVLADVMPAIVVVIDLTQFFGCSTIE
ncbi:Putative 115 kDa protein in type-1 retrotransposable element R1DM [Eumeta japonica]|uniref:115 kDa protein in type-1 retrotransposable element R1DM n=1 Tax=Eumeta variegata TaxID=151549 RepID=A0A4C1ZC62_EUMVA|nr:Putative 115 kDa protein in type-1 retrotransposable element R1DM [Eumeta japonica]